MAPTFLGLFPEQDALQLRQADAGRQQGSLKPQQGLQQRHQLSLLSSIQRPLFGLADQLLDLRRFDLDRLGFFHRHNRSRKSLESGYTHTVLTGT